MEFVLNTDRTNGNDLLYQQLLCAKSLEKYLDWEMLDSKFASHGKDNRVINFVLFCIKHRLYLKFIARIIEKIFGIFSSLNHFHLSNLPIFLLTDDKISANIFQKREQRVDEKIDKLVLGINLKNIEIGDFTKIIERFLDGLEMILKLPEFSGVTRVEIRSLSNAIPQHKRVIRGLVEDLIEVREFLIRYEVTFTEEESEVSNENFWLEVNCVILNANSDAEELYFAASNESKFVFVDVLFGMKIPSWPTIVI